MSTRIVYLNGFKIEIPETCYYLAVDRIDNDPDPDNWSLKYFGYNGGSGYIKRDSDGEWMGPKLMIHTAFEDLEDEIQELVRESMDPEELYSVQTAGASWAYQNFQRVMDLRPGDIVRPLRRADNEEFGWQETWTPSMDNFIERRCEVRAIHDSSGILLQRIDKETGKAAGDVFHFPAFVLEVVERKGG